MTTSGEGEWITVVTEGKFDVGDIRSTFAAIREQSGHLAFLRILILDRGSEFNPTGIEVQEFVDFWGKLFESIPTRIALFVEKELHYGLGRMASVFAERSALSFAVFRTEAEDREWLGASEPAE